MRTIECNECGATITAADDDELLIALRGHYAEEHEALTTDSEELSEMVAEDAYDAMDS